MANAIISADGPLWPLATNWPASRKLPG